ncbi:MAG: SGNH/GDSL hydrolase family protein [Methylocella sp.]
MIISVEKARSLGLFRLITFSLFFLLVVDLASLARGIARDCLLIFASLTFGLCLIEAAAALWEPTQQIVSTQGWSVYRPIIGWGPERAGRYSSKKTDPHTGATIYSADYTIDQNLLRQTDSSQTDSTIAFFGDSITFGVGLNDADTLPQLFADSLRAKERVINLAFSGYGPQHFLREMQTGLYDAAIGPQPKLFIFLTSPWHAERTSCKASWVLSAPRYALENGEVAFKGPCFEGAALQLREFLWNSAAYRAILDPYRQKVSHDEIDVYLRILLAAVTLAKEKYGVPTLIPFIQAPEGYLRGTGFSNDSIIERLREGGADVIDVSLLKEQADGATISIPGDGHPTPLANHLRALMLKHYIEQHMSGALLSQLD